MSKLTLCWMWNKPPSSYLLTDKDWLDLCFSYFWFHTLLMSDISFSSFVPQKSTLHLHSDDDVFEHVSLCEFPLNSPLSFHSQNRTIRLNKWIENKYLVIADELHHLSLNFWPAAFINMTLITSLKFIIIPKFNCLTNTSHQSGQRAKQIFKKLASIFFWALSLSKFCSFLHEHQPLKPEAWGCVASSCAHLLRAAHNSAWNWALCLPSTLTSTSEHLSVSCLYFRHENNSSPRFSLVSDAPTQTGVIKYVRRGRPPCCQTAINYRF